MADYTAPFHKPHMRTEEFDEMKRKYIEKHGYSVTIPGPEDIIHVRAEKPMTPEEEYHWKKKNDKHFTKDRYEEIKYMKKKRKEKFLAMLASPSPKIVDSRSAIITSVDDAQDAASTVAAAGTMAYAVAPKAAKKVIAGPLGWLMMAGDALNWINKKLSPEQRMIQTKKRTEVATKNGPKSSKAKVDMEKAKAKLPEGSPQAKRLDRADKAVKGLKGGGWKGKAIEALQTTDNVYGKGVCLGPLVSLPYDVAAAIVRSASGEKVGVKKPEVDVGHWGRAARKVVRDWLAFEGIPKHYRKEEHHSPIVITDHYDAMSTIFSDEEIVVMRSILFLANQVIHMTSAEIDPLDIDVPLHELEIRAPFPTNILTLEVIEELGDRPEDGCAWPATGEMWSNMQDLLEQSAGHITDNYNDYCIRNAHSSVGWSVSRLSLDAAFYSIENLTGVPVCQIEDAPTYSVINSLQWLNFCVDRELTAEQEGKFAAWLQRCDDENYTPSGKEAVFFAERHCGFSFVQMI